MFASLARGVMTAVGASRASQQAFLQAKRPMSIHLLTRLNVADNSGARELKVIDHVANNPARLGDTVRVVVAAAKPQGRVSRRDIVCAVVVRQKAPYSRPDGSVVRFQENTGVLLKRDLSGPIGTRVLGPVARELRSRNQMKIVMMASRVV